MEYEEYLLNILDCGDLFFIQQELGEEVVNDILEGIIENE